MDMHPPVAVAGKDSALAARYGAASMPPAGPWNATVELLLSHRSIRGYLPDALPEGTLETLVAAAQSAATSSNLQTWSVLAVEDPSDRAALARISNNQKHIEECPLFLVWLADLSRLARLAKAEGVTLEALPYMETFMVAIIDAALAAQNAVIAAESMTLSTVYIGALRNRPEEVAALLGLPPGVLAVFGLCVGHAKPASAAEVKPRLPQSLVLHRGRYGRSTGEENAERLAYDAEMMAFSSRNGMGAVDWSRRAINRTGTLQALSGRDRMRAALDALGFPLK
jgi:nitroreductase